MQEKEYVKQVFSKNKEAYVQSTTHANGDDLSLMVKWLQPDTTMNALDIATGGGHVAKRLANDVKEVTATDITEDMLTNTSRHLQQYKNISFEVADAEALPFQDRTFDIVTCRIAAHHFPHPDQFLSEVYRVLKPNGQFLFIDNVAADKKPLDQFINTLEKMRDYSHVRSLKISEWEQLLEKQHLTIEKQQSRKKVLPFESWVTRTLDTKAAHDKVSDFILRASKEILEYYDVKLQDDQIQSFAIDEWMVLCHKGKVL
ncbi:ubiquinone/menaquinone biosynthesis C-methylase UbiE [Virgibacillus halotolerans]|uniref:class I SAM-dependent methyltransferase n=1 Tax=Virgibacillus halotolerans TaxID=1071053 RepID=UPI00195FE7E0|nr:methyltransferase domain-containing protein [Virgibacillus halotolerans]MBM7598659.1 ubiquinone/menaquinone biosynthesis C-methylase UbiE [Virgibacillus halotolerans]